MTDSNAKHTPEDPVREFLVGLVESERDARLKRYQGAVQTYADYSKGKMQTPFIGWDITPAHLLAETKNQYELAELALADLSSAVLVPVEALKVATRALRNAERANLPKCEREVIFRAIALLAALGGES